MFAGGVRFYKKLKNVSCCRNFVNLHGMWLVQGEEEHKLGQIRPQDCCCSPISSPRTRAACDVGPRFSIIFSDKCWLSELNLVF